MAKRKRPRRKSGGGGTVKPQKHISQQPLQAVPQIAGISPSLFSMALVLPEQDEGIDEGLVRDLAMQLDAYATSDLRRKKMKLAIRELTMRSMKSYGGVDRDKLRAMLYRYAIDDAAREIVEKNWDSLKNVFSSREEAVDFVSEVATKTFPEMDLSSMKKMIREEAAIRLGQRRAKVRKDGSVVIVPVDDRELKPLYNVASKLREAVRKNLTVIAEEIENYADNNYFVDSQLNKTMLKLSSEIREGGVMGVAEKGFIFKTKLVDKSLLEDRKIRRIVRDALSSVDDNLAQAGKIQSLLNRLRQLHKNRRGRSPPAVITDNPLQNVLKMREASVEGDSS